MMTTVRIQSKCSPAYHQCTVLFITCFYVYSFTRSLCLFVRCVSVMFILLVVVFLLLFAIIYAIFDQSGWGFPLLVHQFEGQQYFNVIVTVMHLRVVFWYQLDKRCKIILYTGNTVVELFRILIYVLIFRGIEILWKKRSGTTLHMRRASWRYQRPQRLTLASTLALSTLQMPHRTKYRLISRLRVRYS